MRDVAVDRRQYLPSSAEGRSSLTKVSVTNVVRTTRTMGDQPIHLPQERPEVVVSLLEVEPGADLPLHLHPFPRYGYILSGTLTVTNMETGKTTVFKEGDFGVESVGQWHSGANTGSDILKLLVIDIVEEGSDNVMMEGDA